LKVVALIAVIAALTIGAGVAWAAVNHGSTKPPTTVPKTTPSQTTPSMPQHNGHCPNMGSGSSSSYSAGL
jgi:hypothetical protein